MPEPDPAAVFDAVRRQLRLVARQGTLEIARDTRLDDIPMLDSLRLIETIATVEENVGTAAASLDIDALETVGELVGIFLHAPDRMDRS